jgi:putative transposase
VLRLRLGPQRLRFADAERRLLAEKGKSLGRARLAAVASLATLETILRWYREQIATKYDGTAGRRGPDRPRARADAVEQLLTMAREPVSGATHVSRRAQELESGPRTLDDSADPRHRATSP